MLKKTLLSAAIASTLALSGCLDDTPSTTENAGSVSNPIDESTIGTFPVFSPVQSKLPIPNDLIFDSEAGDGSFSVSDSAPPVTTALNLLSGASTVAPIDIEISALIDGTSLKGPGDAEQNVFLVELEYASGEPVRTLTLQEPPTVAGQAEQPLYTVQEKTLDGTSYIRINLAAPLDPLKRYVVAITNGVTDVAGDPLIASPGAAGYEALTKTDAEFPLNGPLAALASVRALINNLWEPTSLGYINTVRGAYAQPALGFDDLVLTYSFTTSADEKILSYIAEPASWITDQLAAFVKVEGVKAALAGGAESHAQVEPVVNGAYDAWLPSSVHAALAACDLAPTADARFACAGTGLFNALESGALGITVDFPDPENSVITFGGPALDANVFNPAIPATTVSVTQGEMTVPYYSGLASHPTLGPAALKYSQWEADDTLATQLNAVFAANGLPLVLPQGASTDSNGDPVAAVSTVVNAVFPFPKKQGDVTIPVLAMYPTAPTGDMKTMIWGHGLNGNRTQAAGFGPALVAGALGAGDNVALFAIDEPLHGIDDSTSPLLTMNERHFNYVAAPGEVPTPVANADLFSGVSGSMFINIENFMASRGNNLQHALDLFTLRKSIDGIDFGTGDSTDTSLGAFYSGHSLGTINSQAFVATANSTTATDDDITAAMFFTPGGGVTRFFENSPAFAGSIIDGLASRGITVDTSSYQAYLNVLQAALDPFDAVNFADNLVDSGSKVLYFIATNDNVIPVSQATADRTLQTTTSNGAPISGSVSLLSGAEPLAQLTSATDLQAAGNGLSPLGIAVARYGACEADHGTPSTPGANNVNLAAFSENVAQATSIVVGNGAAVNVTDSSLLQALPLPAWPFDTSTCP